MGDPYSGGLNESLIVREGKLAVFINIKHSPRLIRKLHVFLSSTSVNNKSSVLQGFHRPPVLPVGTPPFFSVQFSSVLDLLSSRRNEYDFPYDSLRLGTFLRWCK